MRKIIQSIHDFYKKNPLSFLLILAIVVRLVAVIFAKGFGMHDDHFIYVETPQSWVDGRDSGNWLPWTIGNNGPQGHSLFYPGINFILLGLFNAIGIVSPDTKMLIIRLLHASFSLLVVSLGYKITLKLSNSKTAFTTGLILACLWTMPWLSVRTMVEIVTIPFLLLSIWVVVKDDFESNTIKSSAFLYSGMFSALAFSVRFQVAFFILGLGLVILFKKGFLKAVWFTIGFFIVLFLTQGLIDYLIWKRPFAELMEYARYNVVHKGDYPNGPWYNYILVIMGIVIPPVSLFLVTGLFYSWRKHLILFLPFILFFVFHSYFPNKQERFILPILPFFVISGMIGWHELREKGRIKWFSQRSERVAWIFAITINMTLLLVISTMYSKRTRVESMLHLYKYENVQSFMIENTVDNMTLWSPLFYTGQYPIEFNITNNQPLDSLHLPWNSDNEPRFVLFYTLENLPNRIEQMKKIMPQLTYETTIFPSYIDQLLSTINPVNKNYIVTVYKNNKFSLKYRKS